ncbi:MAG TPA: type I methionyl aminopeptidase [Anaerolineales bacterium]|nr:type I methionyl aminopeptidase [Anaerolineales bacterium]
MARPPRSDLRPAWGRGVVLKSGREIERMRQAGRVTALALQAAREVIRPGVTTAEIDAAARAVLRKHGAKAAFLGYGEPPFPAVTTVSVNEELVHGIPGSRRLREGDIVSVDCGAIVDGFVGDAAFTVGVGQVSPEAQRLIEVTEQALWAGIREMRVGRRTGDVSAAIERTIEAAGFNVVREYTGHGVGRRMHEDPQVPNYGTQGKGMPLREGMTIALEPMVLAGEAGTRVLEDLWTVVSADGRLTAHFEHSVAVRDEGPLILTSPDGEESGPGDGSPLSG